MPDLVLLGDSHLARVRKARLRALEQATGLRVVNLAVGGATAPDLAVQVSEVRDPGVVAISVGTNDAAPWKQVPHVEFERALGAAVAALDGVALVHLGSPGVDEVRLPGPGDRTNARIATYDDTARRTVTGAGGASVDLRAALLATGEDCFELDGVHLDHRGYRVLLDELARTVLAVRAAT